MADQTTPGTKDQGERTPRLYARWEAANRFFEDAARWASQLCNRLWVSYVDVGKTARTVLPSDRFGNVVLRVERLAPIVRIVLMRA
eukprot:scaffold208500_cov40-Tisochrysis_lutea.AAC.3